jgi:hypothetical protein
MSVKTILLVAMPMPTEVKDWLESFDNTLKTKGPTSIVHGMVQLGIDNPISGEFWNDITFGEIGKWFQTPENQRYFNGVIWNMIQVAGKMAKIRQILRKDILTTAEGEDMIGFGKIVEHSYAANLLDYFVGNPKIKGGKENAWF